MMVGHNIQSSTGYSERITFTGKERDEETGFGYFGARYMDYELMTMWLSVDPLADKYPSISPYAYCAWNPVKLVDPDGRDTIISFACRTPDAKQNGKNQRLGERIRNIGDGPYVLAIAMHGSSKEMQTSTGKGETTKPLTAKQMAMRITSMLDGSSLYVDNFNRRTEGREPQEIRDSLPSRTRVRVYGRCDARADSADNRHCESHRTHLPEMSNVQYVQVRAICKERNKITEYPT